MNHLITQNFKKACKDHGFYKTKISYCFCVVVLRGCVGKEYGCVDSLRSLPEFSLRC